MKIGQILVGMVAGALLVGVAVSQTNSQSSSGSQSQNGKSSAQASGSSSAHASSSGSRSAFGSQSASGRSSGSGSGSALSLPKPTHAVFFTRTETWSEQAYEGVKPARVRFFARLQADGKLLYFGPWRDVPGEMSILVATDDEAAKIAKLDPAVAAGILTTEVQGWTVLVEPFSPVRSLNGEAGGK